MTYAQPDSGLLGGIPVGAGTSLQSYFDDAADEIDAAIGFTYKTPVATGGDGGPLPRPVTLILKRINRYLASGRYIMAVASGGEDNGLHAYGLSLVREAQAALGRIAEGDNVIDAERIIDKDKERLAPKIQNAEAKSNVDAYYDAFTWASTEDGMIFDPNFPRSLGAREAEWTRGW